MESITCLLDGIGLAYSKERGMDGVTDRIIVERVIGGDLDAFAVLVDRYEDRIYSAVLNYVSNPEDAVDIAQDAFLKAYSSLRSFNSSAAFYTWLYRIAINTAIDFLRKRKGKMVESLDDDKYTEVGFEPASKDPSVNPVGVAERTEQAQVLRKAISKLSDKLRSVVVLHDVEGLSQEEIAEILRVPVGTVKSRVSRGRAELRAILGRQLGEVL